MQSHSWVTRSSRRRRGGSLDVTLSRADGVVPDDAVLLRIAEKVLPTVPGWKAGG
ncbi:hypothetical protein [Streptomyces tibetensis]|uniref:hypothetical protein n=1 Tax=Streptomyces tibetensis TaxID=2382123 RepID=UPI0033F34457